MSKTQKTEEEPTISEEFSAEIEKYAKLEGISPIEFMEQVVSVSLEKLKKIYP